MRNHTEEERAAGRRSRARGTPGKELGSALSAVALVFWWSKGMPYAATIKQVHDAWHLLARLLDEADARLEQCKSEFICKEPYGKTIRQNAQAEAGHALDGKLGDE